MLPSSVCDYQSYAFWEKSPYMLLVWSKVCKHTSNSKDQLNRGGTAQITDYI